MTEPARAGAGPGQQSVRTPPSASPLGTTALVGRDRDCAVLDGLADAVRAGMSGALVLVGEPGIGKTRLLTYVADAAEGVRVLRIAGVEAEVRIGFGAVHRLLVPFLDRVEHLPAPQRDAVQRTFGLLDGAPPQRLLVGLGVLTLLADVAADEPLVVLVDDAQWLDRESLEVLAFVCRRLYADRVGVVLAARTDSSALEVLVGIPTRHVGGLDLGAARSLLQSTTSGPLGARVAARIVADTRGNPLAIAEIVGELTEDQLAGRAPLPQQLPAGGGMEDHFRTHVEALPPGSRLLVLLASATSTEDPAVLWRAAAVLGLRPDAAEPAVARHILSLDPTVAFRHPLIRAAAYHAGDPRDRVRVHEALAAVAHLDGDLDQAAWHRAAATRGPDERVAAELERSAGRAERRGGRVAQGMFLNRAAQLSPDGRDRARRLLGSARAYLASGDGTLAEALLDQATAGRDAEDMPLAVQRMRASVAVFFSRHKEVPAILLAAADVDAREGRVVREMLFEALQASLVAREYTADVGPVDVAREVLRVSGGPEGTRSPMDALLDGFATRLAVGYAQAVPLLRDSVAALFSDDQLDAGIPTTILGWFAADDVWDDRGRRAMFERAAAIERRHGELGALRVTLAGLSTSQLWAGQSDLAEQSYLEAADISALIGIPAPATTGVLLEIRAWQGREQESREIADLTARWGRERGAAILEIFAAYGLTVLELGLGRYGQALTCGRRILDDDPPGFGNRILPEIVEAGVRGGRRDIAEVALARLADRAPASGTAWALGVLARSRALLAADADAESLYREAIEQLGRTTLRTELARAHLLYGEWLRRRRRRRDALVQLRSAYEMFSSMGALAFAARTRVEQLAAGGHTVESAARPSVDLTPQETQVCRLATTGATNAEIAARLFLTTSTVEYHLSKVFRKLGVSSRRQLAEALSTGLAYPPHPITS